MNRVNNLILSGASVTSSPWFTWADHAEAYLRPQHVVNLAIKGCGNKFIAMSLINYLLNNKIPPNTLIMAMFTCIDKLDLYLDAQSTESLRNEKHPPINLRARYCASGEPGFWSTGSHFPGIKSFYEAHYFNLDWMVTDTIFTFYNLTKICESLQVHLICLFDGDIWQYTEHDYMKIVMGETCAGRNLLDGDLASKFSHLLPKSYYDTKSLFEYAIDKKLSMYNPTCKLHPPSDVHLEWFVQTVLPRIEFLVHDLDQSYRNKVKQFTQEWHHQNY